MLKSDTFELGCSICCSPFFAVYEDILTPPLPLPYKGGECLRISICRGKRKPLPSLVGEGQGWGRYLYFTFVKVHQIEHPSCKGSIFLLYMSPLEKVDIYWRVRRTTCKMSYLARKNAEDTVIHDRKTVFVRVFPCQIESRK